MSKWILVLFMLIVAHRADAQLIHVKHSSRDTAYIKDFYTHHLVLRVFECTKFSNFKLIDNQSKLVYKQNHHNDIGFGFNYKVLFLNVEFTLPFTEMDRGVYGGTNSFDV